MERIALAREYRVAAWLRDAYLELALKTPLDFEELRPTEPYFNSLDRNWEADVKKWKATIRDWETIARILYLQTKMMVASTTGPPGSSHSCHGGLGCTSTTSRDYSPFQVYSPSPSPCNCRVLAMVEEAFRGELESLKENLEHVEHSLPCSKLPLSYLCSLKINLYSQQHRQRRTCYFPRKFKEVEKRKKKS